MKVLVGHVPSPVVHSTIIAPFIHAVQWSLMVVLNIVNREGAGLE